MPQVPPTVYGSETRPRPVPYIFSADTIQRLLQAASELGKRNTFRGYTYSPFALLACTGLRVSEAIHLCFQDITADGLVIRCSKFRKSRPVPLHETTQAGLQQYLLRRRPIPHWMITCSFPCGGAPCCCMTPKPHSTTSSRRSASLVDRGFHAPQSIPFATRSQ
jgi:integrase